MDILTRKRAPLAAFALPLAVLISACADDDDSAYDPKATESEYAALVNAYPTAHVLVAN